MSEVTRVKTEDFSIEAIAESGQCFRIRGKDAGVYTVIALGRVLEVRSEPDGYYIFSAGRDEFDTVWRHYFDLDRDYAVFRSVVPESDEFLTRAIRFGGGIRILNQDPFETLISFIISQRKSIPAIRTSVERLSLALGNEICGGAHAFPDPGAIAGADPEVLGACGLGYRLSYVRNTASIIASGELDLTALGELETDELIGELMKLPGVGIKVASCVALFAYHRLDTVPVDVWMKRVIETVYHGALPDAYAGYAGVLHQYMFNYARINKTGI